MTTEETDIADLKAQLRALKKARASGALMVKHGDVQTTFRSINELNQAIAAVSAELKTKQGTGRAPRYVKQSRKGH
jgi:hypothetical protein